MGIQLEIKDTLGITSANVEIPDSGVIEVVGPNASGKTSLAVAAQAVLAVEANPLGLPAPQARKAYPHDEAGDKTARVNLADGANEVVWYPHSNTLSTQMVGGVERFSDPAAVGLVDFTVRRSAREIAAIFQEALLPAPEVVIERVTKHLAQFMPAKDLTGVIKVLKERDWPAAQAVYAERGRDAKRQWTAITGSNYGVKVAADWRPDDWRADYDALTIGEAEAELVVARDELGTLHRVQAISEVEAAQAEKAKAAIPKLEAAISDLDARIDAQRTKHHDLQGRALRAEAHEIDRRIAVARRDLVEPQTCPSCKAALVIQHGKLVHFDTELQDEIRNVTIPALDDQALKLAERVAEVTSKENAIALVVSNLQHNRRNRDSELYGLTRQAEKAGGELDTPERREALATAEQSVKDCEAAQLMVKHEKRARELSETIVRYTEIARALGPDGVRSKLLTDGMARLNAGLETLAGVADWPQAVCALNGAITIDDRAAPLCSESERWRAQASIQMTLAALTQSQVVVLDRADLLDGDGRVGLAKALGRVIGKTGMSVLLCSTGQVIAGHERMPKKLHGAAWQQVAINEGVIANE